MQDVNFQGAKMLVPSCAANVCVCGCGAEEPEEASRPSVGPALALPGPGAPGMSRGPEGREAMKALATRKACS